MKRNGFTLIEMIVTIVVVGLTMLMLATTIIPQLKNSAAPLYQAKVSALAESLSNEIRGRRFDQNSSELGYYRCGDRSILDGPSAAYSSTHTPVSAAMSIQCSLPTEFGADASEATNLVFSNFNDVDDYIGCWGSNEVSQSVCSDLYTELDQKVSMAGYAQGIQGVSNFYKGPLNDASGQSLIGDSNATDAAIDYSLFTLGINVTYVQPPSGIIYQGMTGLTGTGIVDGVDTGAIKRTNIKRIDMVIDIDLFGRYSFTFYRGNY